MKHLILITVVILVACRKKSDESATKEYPTHVEGYVFWQSNDSIKGDSMMGNVEVRIYRDYSSCTDELVSKVYTDSTGFYTSDFIGYKFTNCGGKYTITTMTPGFLHGTWGGPPTIVDLGKRQEITFALKKL